MAIKQTHAVSLHGPAVGRPRAAKDRDKHELTESIEEYTEGIYRLEHELDSVGTGDIARYMNVQPASATTMLKRLAELDLVQHTPYQGVRLTQKGEELSVRLLRKHRLLERLLVDFLELPWDEVHDAACKLEHYISDDVADRIDRAMSHPVTCPHGNPVDARALDGSVRLSTSAVGDEIVVVKVTDERLDFLSYLMQINLMPGVRFRIADRTPFGDVMTLEMEHSTKPVAVGKEVLMAVWVRRTGDAQQNEHSDGSSGACGTA
jgi:DtxR family Mn-dependent transcriptional regulator